MNITYDGQRVHAGSDARERFYDSRGYGRPRGGDLELAPVEAAHLLYRGDIETVTDGQTGTALGFTAFLSEAVSEVSFFVYKDLRDRGFYLSPVADNPADFEVYPRGKGPWDEEVAYHVRVESERTSVSASALREIATRPDTGVLSVVDEESAVSYFEVTEPTVEGSTNHDIPQTSGELLSDRVLVPDAPPSLHHNAFYGQQLDQGGGPVQLSLVEAAYLARDGILSISGADPESVVDRGTAVEGERFERRLRVYEWLRNAGIVPKTGFKFGADFRTYADVESVDDLGHSEYLVRVLPPDHVFEPRDLALDIRLAHGVRKEMLFALAGGSIDWLRVTRLTP